MKNEPLYILTYDHGGYVLWKDRVKPRLRDIALWMEKYPKLRIGLDYESFTFDEFSREDPEIVSMIGELLKKYPERIGLGATTYGQPLSLYISEESNIRQLTYAIKTNLDYFGITPDVYCISEFALNNQTPQMIKQCGYKAAILRSHVMGYGYTRTYNIPYGIWEGKDGTGIPAVPVYDGQGRGYNCTTLDNWILSRWPHDTDISLEDFRERFKDYSPLLASRYDDLTQDIEAITAETEKHDDYKYILLEDIPSIFGTPTKLLPTTDNDFHSQMPWGYCGNEIFNGIRKCEAESTLSERLNALSVMLGGESYQKESEEGWKYLLAAQHHDVTICGLLDLSRRFIPSSLSFSKAVKDNSLSMLGNHFAHKDCSSLFVMNPHSFPVSVTVETNCDEEMYTNEGISETVESTDGKKRLLAHISLDPLTSKSIALRKGSIPVDSYFTYNNGEGILETPFYLIKLSADSYFTITDKRNGKEILSCNETGILTGHINGKDCRFDGKVSVKTHQTQTQLVFDGFTGDIPCCFTMVFSAFSKRIDCTLRCSVKDTDRIGRTDITEGRPVPLTLNGHHHHDKLCFTADISLSHDRKMFRDLPFSIAEWDGQLRKTEEYWYDNDRILVDTPVTAEQSFEEITHLQGVYRVSLRDKEKGLAVINKGCMGSAVRGNRVYIPLIYSNEYMCGTKIINGEYINEFALLPFDNESSETDIHKEALLYNYPPVTQLLEAGDGSIREFSMADYPQSDSDVILTSLYPDNGFITARFCNFSDKPAEISFSPASGKIICETDLLGKDTNNISGNSLSFRGWEIKTVKIKL